MSRLDWSRLHSKILRSSIWLEDPIVRLVWICAIADSETDGTFYGSYEVLARAWNLPEKDIERAMKRLCAPDPKSSTKDNEGRRIVEEGGNAWRVLNKRLYNKSGEPVGASTPRVQAFRDRQNNETDETIETGNASNGGNGLEENREEENRTEKTRPERERFAPPTLTECVEFFKENKLNGDGEAFFYHFDALGWRSGKGPLRKWESAARGWSRREPQFSTARPRQGTNGTNPSSVPTETNRMPSGDYRLPTGGYAAADRSWFDYKGTRFYGKPGGSYRDEEGYAPDGSHKQNTAYTDEARKIAERVLSPVPVK